MLPPDTIDPPTSAPLAQATYGVAWAAYQRNRGAVTRGRALVGGLSAAPTLAAWLLHELVGYGSVLRWVAYLGSSLVFVLLMPGLTHLAIEVARGEEAAARDVFSQMSRAPAWAITALVHWIMVGAGFLLIVPGLLLTQRLQFAEQFAVARGLGPFEALEASWRVTRMQGWSLFKIRLFQEWNFANRATFFRRGVDAHGADEVEAAVLYLVYEARLFGEQVEGPAAEAAPPFPEMVIDADPVIPVVVDPPEVPRSAPTPASTVTPTTLDAGKLASAFPCPRCGGVAAERRAGERSVFPCVTCGGVWVDNAVSQRLVEADEPEVVAAAKGAARFAVRSVSSRPAVACPVCQATLQRVVVAGLELDVCASHGTWFDRDELPRVVRALTRTPEPVIVRTAPNTILENLENAGRVAVESLASAGHTALDNLLDAISNVHVSVGDNDWTDRAGDSEQHGGLFDGSLFGGSDSNDRANSTGASDSFSSDGGYCNDNDNSSCGNDGGANDGGTSDGAGSDNN